MMMGYSADTKGLKLLDVKTGDIRTARHENLRCFEDYTFCNGLHESTVLIRMVSAVID
jgi:hypothetical protein